MSVDISLPLFLGKQSQQQVDSPYPRTGQWDYYAFTYQATSTSTADTAAYVNGQVDNGFGNLVTHPFTTGSVDHMVFGAQFLNQSENMYHSHCILEDVAVFDIKLDATLAAELYDSYGN